VPQFVAMIEREVQQQLLASRCQSDFHFPAICPTAIPAYQAPALAAIHQLNGAVVAKLHALCQRRQVRFLAQRHAMDGQQQLMLPRL